jgi:hypothetical protein
MDVVLAFLFGVLLRLGIPVAITAGLLIWLHRLDKRWQKEAQSLPAAPAGKPCWEIKGCTEEMKINCLAVANPKTPCWQVFRSKDGVMKETCLGCIVFRQAPVPVRI